MSVVATSAYSCSSSPELGAHLDGRTLVLDVDPADDLHYLTCDYDLFQVEKKVGNAWVALKDERAGSYWQPCTFDGYYLDGGFVQPCCGAGCDLEMCVSLPARTHVGSTVEYVSTGTQPPESFDYQDLCGGSSTPPPSAVPTIESRPVHGLVRTRVRVFLDSKCKDSYRTTVQVTVP
jgi:hypothetical protein